MRPRTLLFALLGWNMAAAAFPQKLDIETLLALRHPSGASWSPDGNRVAFVWDRGGVQNLYLVDRVSGWPEALTSFPEGLLSPPFWSRDGSRLFFERSGELWSLGVTEKGSAPLAVFGTETSETGARPSPDGSQIAFLRLDDVWVRDLESGREKRLTVTPATEYSIVWSPDGRTVAFQFVRTTPREDEYETVGAKVVFRRVTEEPSEIAFVPAAGGAVTAVAGGTGFKTSPAWVDAKRLTFQKVSEDFRSREVLLADVATGEVRSLHRDVDARWWSLEYLGSEPKPSPDGRWVAFVSDRSGWDSLYLVSPDGGPIHRITPDEEEARRFAWSPDGTRIAFDTNRGHPGRRHLAVADVSDPRQPVVRLLSEGRGTNVQLPDSSGFTLVNSRGGWSPDGKRILYQHTDPKRPADLFWIDASGEETAPHELTYSLPSGVDRSFLVEPELVHYRSTDGREVPAYLFVPPDLDRSRKHPAVVWIHGDGIAQNYDGWHVRRDYAVYYSFHQYLAQQGYIVLAPDYRGSIGYGRSWRVAPYRDLGGMDAEDIASAVPYLESLLYVDEGKIGVWGLSYGGFLTLAALTRDPGLFRCGVDVAGVHDFRFWYRDPGGSWVESRLGDPRENAEAYLRAAPVARIDRLEKPLLVLHGTADVNVPFLESVLLVDALLKNGKEVDFAMYPGEFHYFHREHVLRDAWTRVASFFDRNLRDK